MAYYCRGCGHENVYRRDDIYCSSCKYKMEREARRSVSYANKAERRRIENDRGYAHSWLQSAIGWIIGLMGMLTKKGCYITTAVVEKKGMADNCVEMQKLREFRKKYILDSENPARLNDLEEYYILGQAIVRWANSRMDSEKIWNYIEKYVFQVVELIDSQKYDEAYDLFKSQTLNIKKNVLLGYHKI